MYKRIFVMLFAALFAFALVACQQGEKGGNEGVEKKKERPEEQTPVEKPADEGIAEDEEETPAEKPRGGVWKDDSGKLAIGSRMPLKDHQLPTTEKTFTSLGKLSSDAGTLVYFTCNHCPYVKAWETRTVKLANKLLDLDISVIAVNSNDPEEYPEDGLVHMTKRKERAGMNYPYVVDPGSELARAFGADKTPEFFLFNDNGKLVYRGALDDNAQEPGKVEHQYLLSAVEAMLDEEPIETETTKAIGCSIKFRSDDESDDGSDEGDKGK